MKAFVLLKLTVLGLGVFLCCAAQAGWYTAQGEAVILDNEQQARNEAVNDAIRNVLLQAGASIDIAQSFKGGVLTTDRVNIKASTPIRKLQVIDEQRTSNKITVTVKILMDDRKMTACQSSRLKKSMLPLAFRFIDETAHQSAIGIENIGSELDQAIYGQLAKSLYFTVRPVINANVRGTLGYNNASMALDRTIMDNLGRQNEAQYLLIGNIISVSASDVGSNVFTKMFYERTRTLQFRLIVIDTYTGMEVFNQEYSAEADWPFKQGDYVDLRSDRFRGSVYGARLKQLTERAANELINTMQCAMPSARVIEIDGDDFIVNLGREAGLEKNMEFNLSQSYEGVDRQGQEFALSEEAPGVYRVIEAYPHAARLRPVSLQDNVLNVQLDDVVTLK